MLPPEKSRMIQQDKFTFSPLGKAFNEQIKTIQKRIHSNKSSERVWKTFS